MSTTKTMFSPGIKVIHARTTIILLERPVSYLPHLNDATNLRREQSKPYHQSRPRGHRILIDPAASSTQKARTNTLENQNQGIKYHPVAPTAEQSNATQATINILNMRQNVHILHIQHPVRVLQSLERTLNLSFRLPRK